MPLRAWKDIVARTYKRTWDDNVGLVAAGVAFYGFFALLSLLGADCADLRLSRPTR